MKIGIILGSVRPGRMGDRVAKMVSNELGMVEVTGTHASKYEQQFSLN